MHEGYLLGWSWSNRRLSHCPRVDAMFQSMPGPIIRNRLSVRQPESVAYDQVTSCAHVFLGQGAFPDTVAGLHTECACIRTSLRMKE